MSIPYRQEVLRKAVHLSSIWMPVALFYLPKLFNVILFGVCAVLNVLIEIAVFRQVPYVTPLYKALFGKMARESEPGKFRFSGAPPMYASACLTALLFSPRVASCAFAILILSDTAAALIGRRWVGRMRVKASPRGGIAASENSTVRVRQVGCREARGAGKIKRKRGQVIDRGGENEADRTNGAHTANPRRRSEMRKQ